MSVIKKSSFFQLPGAYWCSDEGVKDELKGLAFVCLTKGSDPQLVAAELKQNVQASLGGIASLAAVYVTSMLPKTRTGKTVRRLLIEIFQNGNISSHTSSIEDISAIEACREALKF